MSREKSDQAFRVGLGHHQAGRLAEAEAEYRKAIGFRSNNADALQLLGVVLSQTGRAAEGVELLRRAIGFVPNAAGYQSNLGFALVAAGRHAEAIGPFERAVALEPGNAQHHANLGNLLSQLNHLEGAVAEFRRASELQGDSVPIWMALGLSLHRAGKYAEAVGCFRKVIGLKHESPDVYAQMGMSLHMDNERGQAEVALRRSLEMDPNQHVAWYTLGNVLQDTRRLDEAADAYRRALALRPNFAEAMHNLGTTLREGRKLEEALAQFRGVAALGFDSFELRSNLGVASKDMGDLDEAMAWFERALELKADPLVESNLIYTMHFHPEATPGSIAAAHARWNERYARQLMPAKVEFPNDRDPERRLRVGYVSPDFRLHPVGIFLGPLLGMHDHTKFEIACYSDVRAEDKFTERFRSYADVWWDTSKLNDEQLAELVRADRVDVLVDLTMHMSGSRMLMFARKPAPVEVTYLAYCSTTGLGAMDYRLSDPYLDPVGIDESVYSEKTVRLPCTYWCYHAAKDAPEVSALPAASNGYVTFGCLNNYCKVTRPTFEAWFEILRRVPGSRLLIHVDAGSHRERARAEASAAGIEPGRVEFQGFAPYEEYLKIYHRIDVALDPFPYTGGTTSCDALWMGVPIVTLAGKTAVSRGGFSILSNIGMGELVARDVEQYVRIAAELAGDLSRLGEIRSTLRERVRGSPVCDVRQFARDVEGAYRDMWRRWCDTQH
jgi:predicted O-linked N-acetylglucosamine transferase (SPINDLY family)